MPEPPRRGRAEKPRIEVKTFETSRERFLPILIDMPCRLAFIKLHPLFFVLHRLQKHLRLFLAHLAFLLRLGCFHRLRVLRRFPWAFSSPPLSCRPPFSL